MDNKICIFLILIYATLSLSDPHCKVVTPTWENIYSVICQGVSAPNDFPTDIDYSSSKSDRLLCENCHLETLSSDLLRPIRELEVLNISQSNVQVIESSAFKDFTRIKDIYIEKNNPKIKISGGAFQGPKLRTLNKIYLNNNIKDLTPGFAERLDVNILSLANNEIEEIPNYIFRGVYSIRRLILSYNKIKTLHIDSFAGLQQAGNVLLDHNDLQDIPPGVFKYLSVNWLLLDNNPRIKLERETFSGLRVNKMLLTNSNVKNLPDGFAENLTVVRLDLSNNQIEEIPSNVFKGAKQLSQLILSHNKIKTLHSDSFKGFDFESHVRQSIDLSFNEIEEIPDNIFKDIEITSIKVESTSPIPVDTFKYPSKLISLNLANNKLVNFQNGVVTGLENLQTLILANNSLTSFEGEKLSSLKKLEKLDISGNQIYKLNAIAIISFVPSLKVINLEDNIYQCSELTDIVNVFNEKGVMTEPKIKKHDVRNVEGIACIDQPVDATTSKETFLKQAKEDANEH